MQNKNLSYTFTKFIWGLVIFLAIFIYTFSYYVFNHILSEQYDSIIKAESKIISNVVDSYFMSRIQSISDISKKSVVVNTLMQNKKDSNEINDFFGQTEVLGSKGSFVLYAFDGEKISGKTSNWSKHHEEIVEGESSHYISFLSIDGDIYFKVLYGVNFHGNREGVLEYKQLLNINDIFGKSEIFPISIRDGNFSFANMKDIEKNRIEKKAMILRDKEMTIYLDISSFIAQKKKFNIFFFITFLTIAICIGLYSRKKGIEWFVKPHLELEKMSAQVKEMSITREAMMDSTKFLFLTTDSNGVITFANKRCLEITGYEQEEVVGNILLSDLLSEVELEDRAHELGKIHELYFDAGFEVLVYNARKGSVEDREWSLIRKDLKETPVTISMSAIFSEEEELKGFFAIIDDITVIKKAEKISRKALEDIKKTAEMKTSFLANMSHEIRTPINGVLGMTDLLRQSKLDEEQAEIVKLLESSGETLLYLINEILDFSKIEAQKIQIENRDFQLIRIIEETKLTFNVKAKEKGILLEVSEDLKKDIYIHSDEFRIKQILNNLLSNAIKFTDRGKVSLSVNVEMDKLTLMVKDSGIGMNAEQLKNIFKPFQQADVSITRKYGGTGLGLSITKSLTELMNGQLSVESTVGEGTEFKVVLNVSSFIKEDLAQDEKIVDQLINNHNIKVLVAEDNKINQKVISKILEKLEIEYKIVENGREAVNVQAKTPFDYIFMDMQMPIMDGLSATREIRKNEKDANVKSVKIVALTANAFEEDKKSCFEAGMNEYLSKPVKRSDVVRVIKKLEAA
jgi:PAS domain S-box-containing protein